jgi:hypothetical protein
VFKLLANVGIVGLIAFAMFLRSLGSGLWSSASNLRATTVTPERTYWALCLLVACSVLIFTSIFSEFAYVFGHLWFIFGMAMAVPAVGGVRVSVPSVARVQETHA